MIRIEGMKKIYEIGDGKVAALDDVSLHIMVNEFTSIMGPSGSGKSTLMNILGCLDSPTEGSYFLDGIRVDTMRDNELAAVRNSKIGFVFQSFNLLSRSTALKNVELPMMYAGVSKKERREQAIIALEKVGLKDRMYHKPNEMSGGQRQRVAIARALVNKPPIILADEPTGNLDSKSGIEIINIFHRLHEEGSTIVLVTHEHDIASEAQRILHFKDGKLVDDERISPCVSKGLSPCVRKNLSPGISESPSLGVSESPSPLASYLREKGGDLD